MGEDKPRPEYDNNKEFGLDELLFEPNRYWPDELNHPTEFEYLRTKPTEIIYRAICNWKIGRPLTLGAITGYGLRTVIASLDELEAGGYIVNRGFLTGPLWRQFHGYNYEKGEATMTPRPTLCVIPRKKSWEDKNPKIRERRFCYLVKPSPDKGVTPPEYRATHKHVLMVMEMVSWFLQKVSFECFAAIAYPEAVLRYAMGWYSEKTAGLREEQVYLTEVPDAWVILDGGGIRVEVQLSYEGTEKVRRKCAAAPHGEPVLYIVEDPKLHESYRKLEAEIPNLMVMQHRNGDDFYRVFTQYCAMVDQKKILGWPMRRWYAKRGFIYCVLNPVEPQFNRERTFEKQKREGKPPTVQPAKGERWFTLKEAPVALKREIYQP